MKKLFCLLLLSFSAWGQNEYAKWYFGFRGGLDFSTSPPTTLTNSAIHVQEGCSAVSDAAGNLRCYTNGDTIWNANHQVMANGTGMLGVKSPMQGVLLLKKPQSANLYYLFTVDDTSYTFRYSVIDMTLAAGMGSVTSKNVVVASGFTEKMCAIRKCNSENYWIMLHERGNSVFRAFELTATGIAPTTVSSSVGNVIGTSFTRSVGQMKFSPLGNKIASATPNPVNGPFFDCLELFDFNITTGVVSNPLTIAAGSNYINTYALEFSPDGSKLYSTGTLPWAVYQWNLCAGSSSAAIISSQYTWTSSISLYWPRTLQLAKDGKIYGPVINSSANSNLFVITNPNLSGSLAGFSSNGPTMGAGVQTWCLPNVPAEIPLRGLAFEQDLGCTTVTFSPPAYTNPSFSACTIPSGPYQLEWNFGEPLAQSSNTSTNLSPVHSYAAAGTYIVKLIVKNMICNKIDTITDVVSVTMPTISIINPTVACNGVTNASVFIQPASTSLTYTWLPLFVNTSSVSNLTTGNYTVLIKKSNGSCISSASVSINTSISITASAVVKSGCVTSSASLVISNGSGTYTYSWSPGNYSQASVSNLTAGIYTVQIQDSLNQCQFSHQFSVTTLALPLISISGKTLVCSGESSTLTAAGAATYSWSTGPMTNTIIVSPTAAVTLSVFAQDSLTGCLATKKITIQTSKCLDLFSNSGRINYRLSPNPFKDEITVQPLDEYLKAYDFKLYDSKGECLLKSSVIGNSFSIATHGLLPGVYILEINTNSEKSYFKVLKIQE